MTGRALLRRLLSNSILANRLEDPVCCRFGARLVLEAVAELAAAYGAEGRYYAPDPIADAGRPLLRIVARQARWFGPESVVGDVLEDLLRAKLLERAEDGGLLLPLPERGVGRSSERKAESNRSNARYSTGPRPPGLSDSDWAAVKAERRRLVEERARQQGNLVLPIAGGLQSQSGSQSQSQTEAKAKAKAESQLASLVASGGFGVQEGTATAKKEDSTESSLLAVAVPVPSARESQTESQSESHLASAEAKLESQTLASAEPKQPSDAARELAREGHSLWPDRWSPQQRDGAPAAFQAFLDRGYTAAMVREVMDAKREAPCFGPAYLDKPLRARFPAVEAPAPLVAAGPVPVAEALHPEVDQVPGAVGAPRSVRSGISRVRRALEDPVEGERRRRLDAVYSFDRPAFLLAAKRWPEVWEILGREPEEADAAA